MRAKGGDLTMYRFPVGGSFANIIVNFGAGHSKSLKSVEKRKALRKRLQLASSSEIENLIDLPFWDTVEIR